MPAADFRCTTASFHIKDNIPADALSDTFFVVFHGKHILTTIGYMFHGKHRFFILS